MQVNWCEWTKIINVKFNEVRKRIESLKPRYLILYGGRGSSKSDFTAKYLIYRCLTDNFFRFILVRNTYSTIKDSQYQTLKDTIVDLGLTELFEFKLQPLEIQCINGNKFIARGCDDVTKLKSIKDPTGSWFEEEIPSESDFITISSSIRTGKADQLLEIFTINPEVDGQYQEHWFYKKFFEGHIEDSFEGELQGGGKYIVSHSTYHDNRWLPDAFGLYLESLKYSNNPANRYYYTIYTLGKWGNKMTGGLFYKMFDRAKTETTYTYNPDLPLFLSFDFNVSPGMHCLIGQAQGQNIFLIDEIKTVSPSNNTVGICREFIRRYNMHTSGLFVTGDPSGNNQDTRSEHGNNDYKIIKRELSQFNPVIKVDSKHPPVVARGNFINNIFESNFMGLSIQIGKAPILIDDLLNLKEASDGTKWKAKEKDKTTGVSFERWGHMSDCLDYLICLVFKKEFNNFINPSGNSLNRRIGRSDYTNTY